MRNNKKQNNRIARRNNEIKSYKIMLVRDGKNMGEYVTYHAIKMAQEEGLDLVEVAPHADPPVCQIMDYGKFAYDKQKKVKANKNSSQKEKEITFRYVIDDHDLETKANQARKFLQKGFRVKLSVKFKAREKAHKEQGFVVIKKCIDLLEDIANVEKPAAFEGHNITCRLELKK